MGRHQAPCIAVIACLLAVLACTSNDTLFIRLTATPVPTETPTPLAVNTRFKIGDAAILVSATFQVLMNVNPGPPVPSAASLTTCFPNTSVTINSLSKNPTDPSDQTIYYNVQCGPSTGWVPENWLTNLQPNGSATVKSPDGTGAILYSEADTTTPPVSDKPCPDGTSVSITQLTLNPNVKDVMDDKNMYVQITCGDQSGYALARDLVAVK